MTLLSLLEVEGKNISAFIPKYGSRILLFPGSPSQVKCAAELEHRGYKSLMRSNIFGAAFHR